MSDVSVSCPSVCLAAEHKDAGHGHADVSHDFAAKGGHSVQAPYRGYSMPPQGQQPMPTQPYGMNGRSASYGYEQTAYNKCPPGGGTSSIHTYIYGISLHINIYIHIYIYITPPHLFPQGSIP